MTTLTLNSRTRLLPVLPAVLASAVLALATPGAGAQGALMAPPQNVVSLAATASVELTMDWLTIVFSTAREGSDAAAVQSQLRQALDTALAEARKGARPGEVNVRTGGFSLYPRHAPKGGLAGWQGSAELIVEGRDAAALSQLAGRIQTLTIARVHWSLSREAREKVEGEVAAQAIARFRAKADLVARQFGFGSWTVREVNVSSNDAPGMPVPMMRAQAMRAAADEAPLPVEAGKATVTATVGGSVQLAK